jgi:hypothetical protein
MQIYRTIPYPQPFLLAQILNENHAQLRQNSRKKPRNMFEEAVILVSLNYLFYGVGR